MLFLNGKNVEMFEGKEQCQSIELCDLNLLTEFMSFEGQYAFRGQSNASWSLKTTFERFIENNPPNIHIEQNVMLNQIETNLINNFKIKARIYLNKLGINIDTLEKNDILALMQHYGAPTRLLDVTDSLLNALAFSVIDDSINPSAIYAFRRIMIQTNSTANNFLRNILLDHKKRNKLDESVIIPEEQNKESIVQFYHSQNQCLRNLFQKGFFLIPQVINIPIEKVLANNININCLEFKTATKAAGSELKQIIQKSTIIKIIIPPYIKNDVRKFVFKQISMFQLFPDMYGVTKSLYETDTSTMF